MKLTIEVFWNILMLIMIALFMGQMVSEFVYILEARSSLTEYAAEIECSDNWDEAADTCTENAAAYGFTLNAGYISEDAASKCMLLTMRYPVRFWFVYGEKTGEAEIQTYVR